jgi:hypothetical protein
MIFNPKSKIQNLKFFWCSGVGIEPTRLVQSLEPDNPQLIGLFRQVK